MRNSVHIQCGQIYSVNMNISQPAPTPVVTAPKVSSRADKLLIVTDRRASKSEMTKLRQFGKVIFFTHNLIGKTPDQIFAVYDIVVVHLRCSKAFAWVNEHLSELRSYEKLAIVDRYDQWIDEMNISDIVAWKSVSCLVDVDEFSAHGVAVLVQQLRASFMPKLTAPTNGWVKGLKFVGSLFRSVTPTLAKAVVKAI